MCEKHEKSLEWEVTIISDSMIQCKSKDFGDRIPFPYGNQKPVFYS
jgi:hypothetical protein